MSTHQVSYPSRAKQSMADESERPGTWRSNVGCEAMDEPCTNSTVPSGPGQAPADFSQRNRRPSWGCPFCAGEMLTYANAFHHESRDPSRRRPDARRGVASSRAGPGRSALEGRGRLDLRHGREGAAPHAPGTAG